LWSIKEVLLFILTEIATREKNQISEKIFPVCLDNKPNKYSKIEKIVDSTNELIKALLSTEPSKKISLKLGECADFYHYNKIFLQ
jgi:hypothetical protein